MPDLDPEIWNNKTLGAAANNDRLDVKEKQELENRNARLEGREPREVVVDNDYPGWAPNLNEPVASNAAVVHFADEQENDIPGTTPTDPEEDPNDEPEIPGAIGSEPDGTENGEVESIPDDSTREPVVDETPAEDTKWS